MEQSQTSIQRSRVSLSNGDPAKATNELLEAVSVMEMVSRDDGKGAKDSGEQKRRHPATDALVQAIFELDGTHIDLTDGATRETGSNSMASLLSAVNELQQEVSEEARLLGDIGGRGPAMDDEEAERAAKAFVGVGGSATSKLMEAMSSLEAESFMSFDIVTTVATTPSEMNALERRVFEKYDMNRSGDIDGDELREALSDLGLITDTSQAERLMRKYDVDRSGALELEEFVTLTKELRAFKESSESGATAAILRAVATMEAISIGGAEKATDDTSATKLLRAVADMEAIVQAPSSHERAPAFVEEDAEDNPYAYEDWKMFQKYDTNRSGDIDAAELRHALKDLGLKTDGVLSETVLRKYDTDHSGALELEEFAKLVKELRAFQRVNATTKLLNAVSAMEADERLAALARQNEASRIPGKKRRVTVSAQAALTEATDGMHKASAAPRRTRVDSLPPPPSLPPKSGDRPAFDWPEGNLVVIRRGFLNKDNPNGSFHNVAFGLNIEQKGMNKVVTRGPQYFLNETDATLGGGDAPTSDQIGIRNPVEVGANGQVVEVHRIEETIATHVAQHFGASADIGAMRSWFPPQLLKSNATLQWDEWGGMFAPGTVMTRLPIEVECRGHHATSYAFRQDVSTLAQMEAARQKQSQALVPLIDIGDESQFPPKEAHWSLVIDKETKRPLQCIRTSIVALPFSLDPEWGTAEEREEKGLPFRRGACTCETTIDTFFWDASVPPPEEDDGRCLAVLGYDVADLMKIIDDIWRPLGVHPLFELNTCDPVNEDDDGEEYFHPDLTDPA